RLGSRGADRFAPFGGSDGGDMFACLGAELSRFSFETRRTALGCLRCCRLWRLETLVRGSAIRQCRIACGLASFLWAHSDPDSEADSAGTGRTLTSLVERRASSPGWPIRLRSGQAREAPVPPPYDSSRGRDLGRGLQYDH